MKAILARQVRPVNLVIPARTETKVAMAPEAIEVKMVSPNTDRNLGHRQWLRPVKKVHQVQPVIRATKETKDFLDNKAKMEIQASKDNLVNRVMLVSLAILAAMDSEERMVETRKTARKAIQAKLVNAASLVHRVLQALKVHRDIQDKLAVQASQAMQVHLVHLVNLANAVNPAILVKRAYRLIRSLADRTKVNHHRITKAMSSKCAICVIAPELMLTVPKLMLIALEPMLIARELTKSARESKQSAKEPNKLIVVLKNETTRQEERVSFNLIDTR